MSSANRRGRRESTPADTMRVLVLGALFLLTAGVLGVIAAVITGSASAWALVAFALVVGSAIGWRAKVQIDEARRTAPDQVPTRREVTRYAMLAAAVAILIVAVAGIGSAVS